MVEPEIERLEKIVRQLHKELGSFKKVTEVYDISIKDVIYLLCSTEAGKLDYFKDKNLDHLPIFDFNTENNIIK
jgi:hypothetical protein